MYADLSGVDFVQANLRDARLWSANLRGADLRVADLQGADLQGANLRGAINLTPMQVFGASDGGEEALLPTDWPEDWRARIQAPRAGTVEPSAK